MMLLLIDRWAIRSQQAARRNAMIATTALTQRRSEWIEVEELLASPRETSPIPAAAPAAASTATPVAVGTATPVAVNG